MGRIIPLLVGLVLLISPVTAAQFPASAERPWVFITRAIATGSSDHSDPSGYQVYSAFALDAGLRRTVSHLMAAELTIRTESREVDSLVPSGEDRRLGSLELLPLNLLLQLRPVRQGRVRPYAGAGVNLTVAWEKSGTLDSTDMARSLGPALQAGMDVDLAAYVLLSMDLKWNSMTAKLENGGTPLTDIRLDPLALGLGIGFGF
jgi:outer membrane protein